MKAKKYGGMRCLRNSLVRRHLFFNARTRLALDEVMEYGGCRCLGKWWEVMRVEMCESTFRLTRTCVLRTDVYGRAWDAVKDPDHETGVRPCAR